MGEMNPVMYVLKYRLKEILAVIIIILVIVLLFQTISYEPGKGWYKTPAAEVKINVEK